ncbi:hypothetical protein Tco_0676257 [Tanacetum coccineum]
MGRDTIQLENAVSTIPKEYLLEFTSEYGIPEGLHPSLPGPEDTIVDFPEGKVGMYTKFFEFANFRIPISQFLFDILGYYQIHISQHSVIVVFPTVMDWHTSASKEELPAAGSYHAENVAVLNTRRTPIRKQPELLLCLVGLSRNYLLGDNEYPTFLYDDGREMDLFNLISAPNPSKVKTGSRPRAVLDFDNENPAPTVTGGSGAEETAQDELVHEEPPEVTAATAEVTQGAVAEEVVAAEKPQGSKRRKQLPRKRASDGAEMNAPPKVLRRDHGSGPAQSTTGGNPLQPLGKSRGRLRRSSKGAAVTGDPESEPSSPYAVGSPRGIYQPEWGVTNSCLLNTPKECQELVDHLAPPGYFSELRHLPNEEFLNRYNITLARQVAMGSQLRLRFEQEAKLLRKSVAQVARLDQRIQAIKSKKNNLETLLEAEADIKKAAEARNTELSKELESLRARFADLQVSHDGLFQQVSSLQAQVSGEEKIKAWLEEFKRLEDEKVERRFVEMDARLDVLSIDFDEELYPHTLTAIAGLRWVIEHGFRLAVMKYAKSTKLRQRFADVVTTGIAKGMSEGLKHGVDHGRAQLELDALEAYDPKADTKFTMALQSLKDLEYPLVDQLKRLKDAPLDLIMASLHLENDTGEDAPQSIRDCRPSTSQLKIPVYPEVPKRPVGSEGGDAIAANVSRAEKKRKCRIVCRTHGVGSAHHARSDGVPVSVHVVVPQGLQILLKDAAIAD